MWKNIKPSFRKKLQTILIYSVRNLILPAINIGLSFLVIRLSSDSLWGSFVNQLIWITLALQLLGWGNKEFLLRAFSQKPAKIRELWQENLFSRGVGFVIIAPLFLLFQLPLLSYFHLLVWLFSAFIAQSWEVIILYQRRFFLAIWTEIAGFGLTVFWLYFKAESLDIESIIAAYALGQSGKAVFLTILLNDKTHFLLNLKLRINKTHIIQAFPFLLVGLGGMLNSRIDLYMVNGFLSDVEVGKYQVMTSLFIYVQALAGLITQPFVKNIYRLSSKKISGLSLRLGATGIVIMLGAIPASWWVLNGLYEFDLSLDFFWLGALLIFPTYWFISVLYLCYKHNFERAVLTSILIGILVNVPINYFLIPAYGIKGALIGSVTAQWVILFFYEYYRWKILQPKPAILSRQEMLNREQLLCPECLEKLDLTTFTCSNNHTFSQKNGVIQFLKKVDKERLDSYLEKFNAYRKRTGWHITDPNIYPKLPHIQEATALGHWKPKQHDLRLIQNLLKGKKQLKILEVGTWNGWLSHHLVKWGHSLTTIDYFNSEFDGLESIKYYKEDWIGLQMEVEEMSLLAGKYDVIILNRCYAYYTNPSDALMQLIQKLDKSGMMILTGLNIYKDGEGRRAEFEVYKKQFEAENGFGMMSKTTKGYLDLDDKADLENLDVELNIYKRMIRHRIKAKLIAGTSDLYWGIYRGSN